MSDMANAPLLRRVLAGVIDFVIVPLVSFLLMLITGAMESADAYAGIQPYLRPILLGIAGYILLNGWLLHSRGQTLGKLITGIRIVNADDGSRPSIWKLLILRGPFFAFMYLPFVYALVGLFAVLPLIDLGFGLLKDRRCLHDLAAGTRVVQ